MGGLRSKSKPFTYCDASSSGWLALGGLPRHFAGLFSKDEILWPSIELPPRLVPWTLRCSAAASAALIIGVYMTQDRLPGRLRGSPLQIARELEQARAWAHLEPHGDDPATGMPKDHGRRPFPERRSTTSPRTMADEDRHDRCSRILAPVGGLRPAFPAWSLARSITFASRASIRGLIRSTSRGSPSSRLARALRLGHQRRDLDPRHRDRLRLPVLREPRARPRQRRQARLAGLHKILENKWYVDEAIDSLARPPGAGRRALGQLGFRALHDPGCVVGGATGRPPRAPTPPSSAPRSRATCAPTRCCCSSASPDSASTSWWPGHDPGPALAPDRGRAAGLPVAEAADRMGDHSGRPRDAQPCGRPRLRLRLRRLGHPARSRRGLDPRPPRRCATHWESTGSACFLVLLTTVAWAAATFWSAIRMPDRPKPYFLMLGIAETATLGAFLAQDLLLFVLFFDLMLIPFYFLFEELGDRTPRAQVGGKDRAHPGDDQDGRLHAVRQGRPAQRHRRHPRRDLGPHRPAPRHRAQARRRRQGRAQQPLQAHPAADQLRRQHARAGRRRAAHPADRRVHPATGSSTSSTSSSAAPPTGCARPRSASTSCAACSRRSTRSTRSSR